MVDGGKTERLKAERLKAGAEDGGRWTVDGKAESGKAEKRKG